MAVYTQLTEAQLRNRLSPSDAVFIAESPKVIMTALDAGMTPLSLLCERRHITGDAKCIIDRLPDDFPIYTAERSVLGKMTGYTLTRGVLCAMRRPADRPLCDVLCGARRLAVIDGVTDTTNIGAIFRSAAALGIDGVLLTRTSCDPLNRRSVRVSMGSVFLVPWTWIDSIDQLCDHGFKTVAMALRHDSVTIDDAVLRSEPR
ncbi:MAG: RNA methyltransferase, partial [Muribaculaceae bacterium]|nr:RNA methyltransferase [Muribaculaceae bacterium]